MVKRIITMENTSLIVTLTIIFMVSYTWADCKVKFSVIKENDDKQPVLKSYLQSRNSSWERFKNIMKRRLVDPICTSKEEVMAALCECITKKKPGKKSKNSKKGENEETKESCTWTVLSNPDGTSILKYANMYPCGEVYITQGYAAYDGDVHDVFVVEEKKDGDNGSFFVFKEVAKAMDFETFKEENNSYWSQLYLQGLNFLFNWDKHLS